MIRTLAVVSVLTFLGIAIFVRQQFPSNPLRDSNANIQAWLLTKSPLGSDKNEVCRVIDENGWVGHRAPRPVDEASEENLLGEPIRATLGNYQGLPGAVTVYAEWVFDPHGRLINIEVSKLYDCP